jgi:hypothetical protein
MADQNCATCRNADQKLGKLLAGSSAKEVSEQAQRAAFDSLTGWVEHLRRPDAAEHVGMQNLSNLSTTYTTNVITALGDPRLQTDAILLVSRSLQNQVVAAAFVRAVGGGNVWSSERTQERCREIADEFARDYWGWPG